jgi:uncharacterized protein (DUF433 family)
MATTINNHIWLDDRGVAWVDDTNVKVVEIALDHLADGLTPEEIRREHHDGFTLGQIHAALAYYYDHQAEFDAEIARQVAHYEAERAKTMDSPGRQRLRQLGKIP